MNSHLFLTMMEKASTDLFDRILKIVERYTRSEETFGDAAQVRINPSTLEVNLINDPDEDFPEFDYYEVNDLINPLTDGSFSPDLEAIREVSHSYSPE